MQMNSFVDLVGREPALALRYAFALQDLADGLTLDPKPIGELCEGDSGLVVGDQLSDLIGIELLRCAREASGGPTSRVCRIWHALQQTF